MREPVGEANGKKIGCLIIATALDNPAILSAGQPISPGGSQSSVSKVSDMFSAEQG